MIGLIRHVLPYLFIFFFIIKGNKEPLYFLGISFLMFMSNSIFFEGVKVFQIPGSLDYALMLLWLIFLWILSRNANKKNNRTILNVNALDYCIIGLIIISIFGFIMTIINYSIITDVFKEFLNLFSLFIGYFIIRDWSSHNKPEVLVKFLFSLVVINSIASFLFILHQGLHFNIYEEPEFIKDTFQGVEITRSFYFMPQFLFFSIAYILVFKEKYSFISIILLIVNILAIFISYTRSYIINVAIIFLFYFILTGLKKGKLGMIFKNIFIYGVFSILGIIMLSKFLPANVNYFMERFSELSKSSSNEDQNSLEYRLSMSENIISQINENQKIFGMGPVSEKQSLLVPEVKQSTADMVWTGVIFRWGVIGMLLFILIYLFSIMKAFNFYMKVEGVYSDLALFLLLYIISQIIESFVSWTFMSSHGFTIGLWYFGILSALIGMNKTSLLTNMEIESNE